MSHEIRIPIYQKTVFHGKSRVWLDRCSGMSMPLRVVHKLVEAGFERSSNPLELWVFFVVGHFSTNGSFFGYPPNATLPRNKGLRKGMINQFNHHDPLTTPLTISSTFLVETRETFRTDLCFWHFLKLTKNLVWLT